MHIKLSLKLADPASPKSIFRVADVSGVNFTL